jgi:2-amino-4-hydroxy-6-hydroxymethyldihydropteridine diphosphokinase
MTTAYIGIGSNVGDRQSFCRRAVKELGNSAGIRVLATSGLYETAAVGGVPQRSFVNLVCKVESEVRARELFELCKIIEARLGREPSDIRWGPRVIDLDVLLFDDEKIVEPDLEIPHPRMTERRFVLVPLLEIDPEASDPWEMPYKTFLDETEGEVHYLEPF